METILKTTNQTSGQFVNYTFYIEGVEVPISSLSVTVAVGQPATLYVDVAPFPEGMNLMRGMKVWLFKKINKESPVLRFFGLLVNKQYGKSIDSRKLRLECASVNYRWQTMLMHTVDTNDVYGGVPTITPTQSSTTGKSTTPAKEQAEKRLEEMSAKIKDLEKEVSDYNSKLNSAKTDEDKATLQNEIKRTNDEIRSYREDLNRERSVVQDTFSTINNRVRTSDVSYLSGGVVIGLPSGKNDISDTAYANNNASGSRVFRANLNIDSEGKTLQTASPLMSLFDRYVTDNSDYIGAFIGLIRDLHKWSDPYIKKEAEDINFDAMLCKSLLVSADGTVDPDNKTKRRSDISSSIKHALKAQMAATISNIPATYPFISALINMLDGLFFKVSVDPVQLDNSICIHPMANAFFPPRCNVIFPCLYNDMQLNMNSWNEPTRTYVQFPRYAKSMLDIVDNEFKRDRNTEMVGTGVLADTSDPFFAQALKAINDTKVSISTDSIASGKSQTEGINAREMAMEIMSDDELAKGIVFNTVELQNNSFSLLDDKDKIDLANFLHGLARYAIRACTISTCVLDTMVVGMPVLLLDGHYSIHGTLEAFSYTVSSDGYASGSATIGYPKFIFLGEDQIPVPPLWMSGDNTDYQNIGKEVYMKMYGCGSVTDPLEDTLGSKGTEHDLENRRSINPLTYTDTTILAICTAELINAYNTAPARWAFSEKYRARLDYTADEIMQKRFKCSPADGSMYIGGDEDLPELWSGDIFSPYNDIDNKTGNGHVNVNKQDVVIAYTNKINRGTSCLAAGILSGDAELDPNEPFELLIDTREVSQPYYGVLDSTYTSSGTSYESGAVRSSNRTVVSPTYAEKESMKNWISPLTNTVVTSEFGGRVPPVTGASADHKGMDFRASKGTAVMAVEDGTIVYAGSAKGYGNVIYLKHLNGLTTRYAHLSKFAVKSYQVVRKGDVIGYAGNTGVGSGPHLHFEVCRGSNPMNPDNIPAISKLKRNKDILYERRKTERS